jgi:hypothetical protein
MADGKVAEHWVQIDQLALLQQLELIVVPGPQLLARILVHQAKKLRRKLPGSRLAGDADGWGPRPSLCSERREIPESENPLRFQP